MLERLGRDILSSLSATKKKRFVALTLGLGAKVRYT
jgi:hypothetical protein